MPPSAYLAAGLCGLIALLTRLVVGRHEAERRRRWNATDCPHCGEGYRIGRDHAGVSFRLVTAWPEPRRWGGERTEVRHALTCLACERTTEFAPDGNPVADDEAPAAPTIDWPRHFLRKGNAR